MERLTRILILIGALDLLALGTYLGFQDKTASSTAAFGFGFLLIILLLLSKFKRFKGFGFTAEMWDEKQIEAAKLVDRLKVTSESLVQQASVLAANLGMMNAGLTLPQKAHLFAQLLEVGKRTEISEQQLSNYLDPLFQRIRIDFCWAAERMTMRTYQAENDRINRPGVEGFDDPGKLREYETSIGRVLTTLQQNRPSFSHPTPDYMGWLIEVVRTSRLLESKKSALLDELEKVKQELNYFETNRKFRNEPIDYTYLWN